MYVHNVRYAMEKVMPRKKIVMPWKNDCYAMEKDCYAICYVCTFQNSSPPVAPANPHPAPPQQNPAAVPVAAAVGAAVGGVAAQQLPPYNPAPQQGGGVSMYILCMYVYIRKPL